MSWLTKERLLMGWDMLARVATGLLMAALIGLYVRLDTAVTEIIRVRGELSILSSGITNNAVAITTSNSNVKELEGRLRDAERLVERLLARIGAEYESNTRSPNPQGRPR